jgi:hypothetical protein
VKPRKRRRWISIGGKNSFGRTLRRCRELGAGVLNAGKPGMVAWYGFLLLATGAQMLALESWWREQGIESFRRMPRGAWPVSDADEPVSWEEIAQNCREYREAGEDKA